MTQKTLIPNSWEKICAYPLDKRGNQNWNIMNYVEICTKTSEALLRLYSEILISLIHNKEKTNK
jgi:hypothetical protein